MRIGPPVALLAAVLLFAACGGEDDADDSRESVAAGEASYDEGAIGMEIEMLDTGLLKGHSYVDANDGWTVEGVTVTAVTDDGTDWGVIEIKEQSDADATVFFEVQIQELPRGDQVTLTTTAFFRDSNGFTAERTAVDHWPP